LDVLDFNVYGSDRYRFLFLLSIQFYPIDEKITIFELKQSKVDVFEFL